MTAHLDLARMRTLAADWSRDSGEVRNALEAAADELEALRADRDRLAAEIRNVWMPQALNSMSWQEGYDEAKAALDAARARADAAERDLVDIDVALHAAVEGLPTSFCSWCARPTENKPDLLREHLRVCEKHPMREVEARAAKLEAELVDARLGLRPPPGECCGRCCATEGARHRWAVGGRRVNFVDGRSYTFWFCEEHRDCDPALEDARHRIDVLEAAAARAATAIALEPFAQHLPSCAIRFDCMEDLPSACSCGFEAAKAKRGVL